MKRQQFSTKSRVKSSEDGDVERDELGCISDAEVERARQELRRQRLEQETGVVLHSSNGHKDDDWGRTLYKSLTGIHVEVKDFEC
jgi:hypothetical protein